MSKIYLMLFFCLMIFLSGCAGRTEISKQCQRDYEHATTECGPLSKEQCSGHAIMFIQNPAGYTCSWREDLQKCEAGFGCL